MQRLEGAHELLDGPLDERELRDNLRDLARANRWLGGAGLSWRALEHVMTRMGPAADIRLLDVGTGAADIPLALLDRARSTGRRLEIEAVDSRPEVVAVARARAGAADGLSLSIGRGQDLDFPDDSFDVVHVSLVLHHHDPHDARRLLAELGRVARRAVIVNDLQRARRWLVGAWLLSRLATGNRYTRHDAPLSVRRAYSADEMSALGASAGLPEQARFGDRLDHRYAIVFWPAR